MNAREAIIVMVEEQDQALRSGHHELVEAINEAINALEMVDYMKKLKQVLIAND